MLHEKVAVVTGAASGIGRCLALRLAQRRAAVWALDVDGPGLERLAGESRKLGVAVTVRQADVTSSEELAAVRSEIEAAGRRWACWINNAGISLSAPFVSLDEASFERIVHVDLLGVVNGTRTALAAMAGTGGGTIVNVGSVAGHVPAPFLSAYNAAKFGVTGFTRALRAELRLAGSPVRLVLVSPGFVATPLLESEEDPFPAWLSFLVATPEAVADAIIRAVVNGDEEVSPGLSGRLMQAAYRLAPATTVRAAHLLLAKDLKDAFRGRFVAPSQASRSATTASRNLAASVSETTSGI